MSGSRTNYVLCCWSGPRRMQDPRRDADPAFYLREHIKSLETLPHSLTQITVVVPMNPEEPAEYREFLRSLPSRIQGAEVVLMERPNVGLSYGSLADCYARYRTSFDYYFFVEDDYVFTQPHFDAIHIGVMKAEPRCGYLCGLAWANGRPMHAGVPHGIMRASALERVFLAYGAIPHAHSSEYAAGEHYGQIGQSQAIIAQGFMLRDWAGKYRVVYREHDRSVVFHEECAETMVVPV